MNTNTDKCHIVVSENENLFSILMKAKCIILKLSNSWGSLLMILKIMQNSQLCKTASNKINARAIGASFVLALVLALAVLFA